MSDERRHQSRPTVSRSRLIGVAAAAAAVVLVGGVAVAGALQGSDGPQITGTTLDPTTTETTAPASGSTETTEAPADTVTPDTTVDDTTPTIDDDDDVDVDQAGSDDDEGTSSGHPENHGKDVSEAAHDHSHDDEAGNHGRHVSSVARDKGTSSTTAPPSGAGTSSSGHGRRGR